MRILITGANGFLGRHLAQRLGELRHEVRRLERRPDPADPRSFAWDPQAGRLDDAALQGVDAVVHLAGAPIAARRWDPAFKQQLLDSRVASTRLLLQRLAGAGTRPRVFLAASAVGIYGDRGDERLTEASAPGSGFLAGLCRDWEAETGRAAGLGLRLVQARVGLVLGPDGGLLQRLRLPFKLGLGGRLGSGRQWMSWIAMDDLVSAFLLLLEQESLGGAFNLTAPNPVTNAQFTQSLGRALNRPAVLCVPAFAIKAALGEMGEALLLGGQRVLPERLAQAGFRWRSPWVGEALNHLNSR
jgi:uncharacterized protein (TIGR01777 family)